MPNNQIEIGLNEFKIVRTALDGSFFHIRINASVIEIFHANADGTIYGGLTQHSNGEVEMTVGNADHYTTLRVSQTAATLNKDGVTRQIQGINVADDFADDAAAAIGLIPVGGLYHTSGAVKIRLS